MKDECNQCDLENYIRKSRAYFVCNNCGRDITLEVVLLSEVENETTNI